jgi:hypothetical protein
MIYIESVTCRINYVSTLSTKTLKAQANAQAFSTNSL